MIAKLLDTSVFIAREVARPLGQLPDRVAVSVINIGEIVPACWRRRTETFVPSVRTRSHWRAGPIRFPVDEAVMSEWAHLVISCRRASTELSV